MKSKKKILKRLKDAKMAYNSVMTRLAAHDEEFEALGEGINATRQDLFQRVKVLENVRVNHLGQISRLEQKVTSLESGMGHATGNQIIQDRFSEHSKRLTAIEGILNNTPFSSVLMKELVNRVTALEGDRHTFLPHQHIGVEDRIKALENKTSMLLPHNHEMHDQRIVTLEQFLKSCNARMRIQDENIDTLKTQTAFEGRSQQDQNAVIFTLQQQVKEINARLMALTNKYLELRPGKLLCENKPGKLRKVTEKEYRKIVSDTAPVSTRNLLAVKKSGRTRKVKHD
jgi:hypothetical protein